jgi:hypothetical protein
MEKDRLKVGKLGGDRTSCVMMDKSHNFPELQFPHLNKETIIPTLETAVLIAESIT